MHECRHLAPRGKEPRACGVGACSNVGGTAGSPLGANSEDWVASLERRLAEQELSKEDTGLEQDAELAVVSASRLRR
jgi:hypothetical protein